MTVAVRDVAPAHRLDVREAAALPATDVLRALDVASDEHGLTADEVLRRRGRWGPNAVSSHRTGFPLVLWHQVRSPLLALLLAAAGASYVVGEHADAVIIAVIVALSVGLGFVNEYRAEKSAANLHSQIRHRAVVIRDRQRVEVNVTDLVPGDVVLLTLGEIVPADVRLLDVTGLECDESVLTGESLPVVKSVAAVAPDAALADLSGCALMGTVVHAGTARAVVVDTGLRSEFGKIAAGLSTHQLETEFQVGLRKFSMLLVYVAGALTTSIFAINVLLHKPVLDALLFSLAIAVGITPQLLPAVVSTSLAAGSRRLSRRKVLVKRLVCIEDLGDVDTLFTDKTGTLTLGRIQYMRAVPAGETDPDVLLAAGLVCTENAGPGGDGVGGNPLDRALWDSPAAKHARASLDRYTRLGVLPFDHKRLLVSVVARGPDGRLVQFTKGAPETVLSRCPNVPEDAHQAVHDEFAAGNRVVAVATRPAGGERAPTVDDEQDMTLLGFLVFLDPPKSDARDSLGRLAQLGITVKVVTGDNPVVAAKVCRDLGIGGPGGGIGTMTGTQLADLDDAALAVAIPAITVSRGSARRTRRGSCACSGAAAAASAFSATVSMTRSRCTPRTWESPWTRPPTSRRTPPTWCCWRRASTCWPTASPRGGASSRTRSSTC